MVLALLILVLSSKMPTYYYPPLTISICLLPSSPARSDIEQLNSKLSTFIKWLQGYYLVVANIFTKIKLILIKEDYNFKLLKYMLFNSNKGHIKLYTIGLIYRVINYIANCLKDFRIN